MFDNEAPPVFHWNTDDIPVAPRFDRYVELLSRNLIGVTTVCDDRRRFKADIQIAQIGRLQIAQISGSAKRSSRTKRDIATSGARAFHLVSGNTAWEFQCMENRLCLNPGDLVLIDTEVEYSSSLPEDFKNYTAALPVDFIQSWLPDPAGVTGKRLSGSNDWGAVLSTYVSQLAKAGGSLLPLHASILQDQLGALLALAASDMQVRNPTPKATSSYLYDKIVESIRQRCTDLCMTAFDVATDVNISLRTLHRVLATSGKTFGSLLISARCEVAYRMLTSSQFNNLTISEIGKCAGFVDSSHFSRTCRLRYGYPPAQLRRKYQKV